MKKQAKPQPRSASPSSEESTSKRFKCTCGKQYKSKPAVYTHIKIKHNNDQSAFHIIDVDKGEINQNRTFRIDNIKYNEQESAMMTLADTTFGKIASIIKAKQLKTEDYLERDDYLSDSEEEDPRDNHLIIQEKLARFGLSQEWKEAKQLYGKEMQNFVLGKHVLNISNELCKFFSPNFSIKAETELALQWLKLSHPSNPKIQQCSLKLWQTNQQELRQQIMGYFTRWRQLRRL